MLNDFREIYGINFNLLALSHICFRGRDTKVTNCDFGSRKALFWNIFQAGGFDMARELQTKIKLPHDARGKSSGELFGNCSDDE